LINQPGLLHRNHPRTSGWLAGATVVSHDGPSQKEKDSGELSGAAGAFVILVRSRVMRSAAVKFMMFVCTDTAPDTDRSGEPDVEEWVAQNDGNGRRLDGDRLAPPSAATTVRVRNGELLVSDGPFAETKEVIVGYDVLECADLDEAIEVARAHPMARGGRLELRPFFDPEDPAA
jgi:hypothetical protein